MAQHAKLAPSASHRWINCPGSYALIGDESSPAGLAAMKGTAAHKIIEQMIENGETDANAYGGMVVHVHQETGDAQIIYEGSPDVPDGWYAFDVDETMVAGVQTMIDEVHRRIGELFDPKIYSERWLDMSWLDPRLGGTADVTLAEPFGWVELLDYKNGYGVVEVTDNTQLKTYAVGLLAEHPDAEGVRTTIVQPNAPHEDGVIRTQEFTRDELKLFEIELKEAADATLAPNAPLRAGEWCTWCPAKSYCEEFARYTSEQVGADFAADPPEELHAEDEATLIAIETDAPDADVYRLEQLARKAKWVPVLDAWSRDIEGLIQRELEQGHEVPGWKLVLKRSNRVFVDQVDAQNRLVLEGGVNPEALFEEPKFKSPAKIEKLRAKDDSPNIVKPKRLKELVAELTTKPMTGYTVAPMNDPREAINPATLATMDFAHDPPEELE